MMVLLVSASAACAVWSLYYYLDVSRSRKEAHEKLNSWLYHGAEETSWSDSLSDKIDSTEWAKKMRHHLEQASLEMKPSEYGSILALAVLVTFIFLYIFAEVPSKLAALLIAFVVVPIGSRIFLKSRRYVYVQKLDAQLSEACRLLSSAARAGLSVPQGLELVVQEMPSPIRNELGRVVREVKLGRSLEAALKELLERVHSKDIQVFVNALIIQRRAGGDLAKVMSEMAATMEERRIINQTIQAVTAQARTSAYALPILSLFIAFMLSKTIDGFYDLFTQGKGIILLVIFVLLQVTGVVLVRKLSNIRV